MNFRLDSQSSRPIYAQIIDGVRHMVATGELKPGDQLPTVRDLAAKLHVNVNTVVRAYDRLDEAGVISTQQGRGCYVAERPDEAQLSTHRRGALHTILDRALLEALSLGYTANEIKEAFSAQFEQWKREQQAAQRRRK